jgi:hypothetical protein
MGELVRHYAAVAFGLVCGTIAAVVACAAAGCIALAVFDVYTQPKAPPRQWTRGDHILKWVFISAFVLFVIVVVVIPYLRDH